MSLYADLQLHTSGLAQMVEWKEAVDYASQVIGVQAQAD